MEATIKSIKYDSVGVCFNMRIDVEIESSYNNEIQLHSFYTDIDEITAKALIHNASRKNKLQVESNGTDIVYYFI